MEGRCYSNNKVVSKDTEQDIVLVSTVYWHITLNSKFEKFLRKKIAQNRHVWCNDTNVIVSLTDRCERVLIKQFDNLGSD
jgi:hypothetical protein